MKYIIKNCPNYDECGCRCTTDCLLKQIVEKCKNAQLPLRELQDNEQDIIFQFNKPEKPLADDILNLLEIEELKDENYLKLSELCKYSE